MGIEIDISVAKKPNVEVDIDRPSLWISCKGRLAARVSVQRTPIAVEVFSSPRIDVYAEDGSYAYVAGTILMDAHRYILTTLSGEVLTVR